MCSAEKVGAGSTWRQTDISCPPVFRILIQHLGRCRLPVFDRFCKVVVPLLTGTAPQTEFHVTPTKQTPKKILTGARTHIRSFRILPKLVPQSHLSNTPSSLLTETSSHSELALTNSKQTTAPFLTETGIAHRFARFCPQFIGSLPRSTAFSRNIS
jgi:hypothetical protein